MSKATFTPAEGKRTVELVCGTHTKNGKFRPKNVKLSSISRLYKCEWRDKTDLYIEAMKRKNPNWSYEDAQQRWNHASESYFDYIREVRIERRLNQSRSRQVESRIQA